MLVHVRDMNCSSNETFCITNRDGWFLPGYWAPDNKKVKCSQLITLSHYDIWLLDIKNNEMVQITPSHDEAEKSRFIVGPWSPDGKGFYVISDLQREYASLART